MSEVEEIPDPPLGRYEKYPVKDCALLMTSADGFLQAAAEIRMEKHR